MLASWRIPQAPLLLVGLMCCFACQRAGAGADTAVTEEPSSSLHCPQCDVMVGAGATVWPWHWTDGVVLPALVELDGSRFELGAFRFATQQYLKSPGWPPYTVSAHPYWGFSAMRRWQVLHRSRFKLYLGLGVAYRSETDLLEASKWNFAYLVAVRYSLGRHVFLELGARHWSDAWIRFPNRGQNVVLITVGFR
jgi:hypothetical protein